MAITISARSFATIWAIPHHDDAAWDDRVASVAGASAEMLAALALGVSTVALRTAQLRKAGKLAIGLEALLAAYQHDAAAFLKHAVSAGRPRPDEVEAQVRAGRGPRADTIAKAVAFMKVTGQPHPGRDALVQAADYMAARSLIEDREAALVRVMIQ